MRRWIWLSIAIVSFALIVTTAVSHFAYAHGPRYHIFIEPHEDGGEMTHFHEEDVTALEIPGWVRSWRGYALEDSMATILFGFGLVIGLMASSKARLE